MQQNNLQETLGIRTANRGKIAIGVFACWHLCTCADVLC